MAPQNLAEALAADIADVGLAELVTPGSLKALDSNDLVELEQDGDVITVFHDGEVTLELSTSDENFNELLMAQLATALNF